MTAATEDRIARLMLTLSVHCGHLDLTQFDAFVRDICQKLEQEERDRNLQILAVAERRIDAAKGRSWRTELAEAKKEIEFGHQKLFQ